MTYIVGLEDVGKESKNVGAKASNLGEMMKAGLPVLPGFVLTTEAYEMFLRFNKLDEKLPSILKDINVENIESLKQKSKEIEDIFIKSEVPDSIRRSLREFYDNFGVVKEAKGMALDIIKAGRDRVFVSVRSSVIVEDQSKTSFAGLARNYINISGMDSMIEAIKRSWASNYSSAAIFYRKRHGIESQSPMGIIIQKMGDPEKAGALFTADPLKNDKTKIIIESSWGLGQSVSSGFVSPDLYILEKDTGHLVARKIHAKGYLLRRDQIGKTIRESVSPEKASSQSLTDFELSKLLEMSKKIEDLFNGQSQDIEWCIERGRIFILQARPLTALEKISSENHSVGINQKIVEGLQAFDGFCAGKAKIINSLEGLSSLNAGEIVVSRASNPDFVPFIGKIAGLITDEGGITSNMSTICREFGIPILSGTGKATQLMRDGQNIEILENFVANVIVEQQKNAEPKKETPAQCNSQQEDSMTATEIKIIVSSTSTSIPNDIDGIGLLKPENLMSELRKNPVYLAKTNRQELIDILVDCAGKLASSIYPKPVWYRLMDFRQSNFPHENMEEEAREPNPLMGWRGIRRSLDQPEVLICEIEAIKNLYNNGVNNISVLLPFVISSEEVKAVRAMFDFPIKIGIIVETPAASFNIEKFLIEGVDFVSIGLNDLTQLMLGIDRENTNVSKNYNEMHLSVIKQIKFIIDACKKYGVKTSICGDGPASMPELVEKLVGFGIDSISVEPEAVQAVKSIILRTERRLLLERVRKEKENK